MNSIADVLAGQPRPSWQECVALVQEIASQLAPGQPVPAPEDLLLADEGTLTFGFAGESKRPQVTDLGSLLLELLNGVDAPQALLDLAVENSRPEPAHATMDGFSRALAFYERPNRRSDVAAVAGRIAARAEAARVEAARVEEEIGRLRHKVVVRSGPELAPPDVPVERTTRSRWTLSAGLLGIAVVTGAAVWRTSGPLVVVPLVSHPTAVAAEAAPAVPPVTPAAPPVSDEPTHTTAAPFEHGPAVAAAGVIAAARQLAVTAGRPAPRTHEEAGPAPHGAAVTRDGFESPASARRVIQTTGSTALPVLQRMPAEQRAERIDAASGSRSVPIAATPVASAPTVVDPSAVYSKTDAKVQPPVLLRQQLPSQPLPDAQTGYFEFVVDMQGDVEDLRLISPTRRYQDRMLVAAAKAWKFRPARLDGRPVKYRMRVPITLQGPIY